MTSYWLTNVALSLLVLIGLPLLRTAPPRLRLWMSLGAVAAWYVPWPTLSSIWSSSSVLVRYIRLEAPVSYIAATPPPAVVALPWQWIVAGATTVGLFLFVRRVIAHQRLFQSWRKEAVFAPKVWHRAGYADVVVPLSVVDGLDNAFVSGYFRPHIWIGQSQASSPALASILEHELVHARHHDNLILLFITLTADLFWWNPLVWLLVRQVRRDVELSCDVVCSNSSSRYKDDLASELLNRQYRTVNSRLINPMSWRRGFNVYRIRQLDKETSMKIRHLCILALILVTSFVFVSNIAVSQETTADRQIINHLTITTIEANSKRESITEFIGEPEVQKLLRLGEAADVTIDVHMDGDFRRVIVIKSTDMDETRKVLAAFENTEMERGMIGIATGESSASLLLDVVFEATDQPPYAVTLAAGDGQWTGVTVGDYLLRVRPDRGYSGDQAQVLVSAHISRIDSEQSYELLSSPRLVVEMGSEAVIQVGDSDGMFTLKILPRPLF